MEWNKVNTSRKDKTRQNAWHAKSLSLKLQFKRTRTTNDRCKKTLKSYSGNLRVCHIFKKSQDMWFNDNSTAIGKPFYNLVGYLDQSMGTTSVHPCLVLHPPPPHKNRLYFNFFEPDWKKRGHLPRVHFRQSYLGWRRNVLIDFFSDFFRLHKPCWRTCENSTNCARVSAWTAQTGHQCITVRHFWRFCTKVRCWWLHTVCGILKYDTLTKEITRGWID